MFRTSTVFNSIFGYRRNLKTKKLNFSENFSCRCYSYYLECHSVMVLWFYRETGGSIYVTFLGSSCMRFIRVFLIPSLFLTLFLLDDLRTNVDLSSLWWYFWSLVYLLSLVYFLHFSHCNLQNILTTSSFSVVVLYHLRIVEIVCIVLKAFRSDLYEYLVLSSLERDYFDFDQYFMI